MHLIKTIAVSVALVATASMAQANETLEAIKGKGFVQCGVSQGLLGFSNPDDQGNWAGLDVDFCHAMAAGILNDADAVKFTPLASNVRFTALASGEIDILAHSTSWTMSRDSEFGEFIGVSYYDGQGFLVPRTLGVSSATELNGKSVCTQTGTSNERNVAEFFRANNFDYTVVAFEKAEEVVAAYDAGRCDVYTASRFGLASQRTKLADPSAHVVLPEIISKEPLGPMVRHGDSQWADIARWTLNCMINAEESGINQGNVAEMAGSTVPAIKLILGSEGDLGKGIGLGNEYCANIIAAVGNYGESYERHFGPDTPLKLDRGVNTLWSRGGLLFAAPQR